MSMSNLGGRGLVPNGFNPSVFMTIFQTVPFHLYIFNSVVIAGLTTIVPNIRIGIMWFCSKN